MRCSPPSRANSALARPGMVRKMRDLLAVFQLGLEADHVEQRAELVVLAQLHHGIRLGVRPMRIGQAERFHRPMAQRLAAALGHHFDRQAAVEIGRGRLEIVERDLLAGQQRIDERVVLRARERAIDVVGAGAGRVLPCRSATGTRRCRSRSTRDARSARWRRRRRARLAGERADRFGQRRRGERAGGDDDAVPFGRRPMDFLAANVDRAARLRAPRLSRRQSRRDRPPARRRPAAWWHRPRA